MLTKAVLTFSETLRSARKAVYKQQKSAMIALNISHTGISMYENGLRLPTVPTLKKLCDGYRIDFEAMLLLWAQAMLERSHDDE